MGLLDEVRGAAAARAARQSDGRQGPRLRAVARLPGRRRCSASATSPRRSTRPSERPAVRAPSAVVVSPRPSSCLARRRSAGPGRSGRERCLVHRDTEVVHVVKGHGTENDFVLLPDLDGAIDLTAELTRRLCDRRAGIGADGVLRVVRSENDDDRAADSGARSLLHGLPQR